MHTKAKEQVQVENSLTSNEKFSILSKLLNSGEDCYGIYPYSQSTYVRGPIRTETRTQR
ncbi:hypothetical protein SAMN04515668_4537 [Hymenobacter arizonensis]|uniref:Uncharacterized protein n=1 Tax=Hymenobacter arizonensis TaxID=1227077 RepID=A0A1I6BH31_HYMAR|nr:hypothetical protein SAMN04515668_4537 [Hymenobacter arizonensis]